MSNFSCPLYLLPHSLIHRSISTPQLEVPPQILVPSTLKFEVGYCGLGGHLSSTMVWSRPREHGKSQLIIQKVATW